MAIFDNTDKVQKWRYHVASLTLLIDGDSPVNIPSERVQGITITHDYLENYFPIIKLELILEADLYYLIMSKKNNCKISLRVDKYYHALDSKSKSIYRRFINDKFDLIMDENTEDMYLSLKTDEANMNYQSRTKKQLNQMEKANNHIALHLFKADVVNGTKVNVNKILSNCNVTDAIAYLATQGKINNLLMAPADNTEIYPVLLLPPASILKTFAFLDTYYGIYEKGSILYFGLDYTYIIPYSGECKAYYPNEVQNTTIIVPKGNDATHTSEMGTLNKGDGNNTAYIIADFKTIQILNSSISNNVLNANDIQVVDTASGSSDNANSKAIVQGKNVKRIFENKTENDYIASMYIAQTNALNTVIRLRAADYDVSALAPNKKFQILFEDSNYIRKYKKNYILVKEEHFFLKEGEDMVLDSVLTFHAGDN